ncbi:alpha-2-macroglobulin family protein [Flammeovirga aprica]|uniref:TonB-dependent receptor plug domain-containing protein n=1 Tax=Flammeovirga aprica JL-4 TaxID=694437 RepID=A0A7X9NZY4_9BACT|nr:alpha-2-macroglobulin family protein [Flammeovirga aprica]NME67014.1 TonB-dependent receptor plug domain-containing protein [Flammeovirga aprica JL-4]
MAYNLKLLFFTLLISSSVFSQDLLKSRRSSYYTYVYKITNQEAEKIYKNGIEKVDDTFFHSLVDSVAKDFQTEEKRYPVGHYLFTQVVGSNQHVELHSEESVDVFVLNNDKDLVVQVYNLEGNSIEDAKVKVNQKVLRFDNERHAYVDQKSNKDGLLKVTYGDYTSFVDLEKDLKNSAFKRAYRKVVYSFPLKYIYLPVRYVVYLPIDGVKSIKRHYPQGVIYSTTQFFTKKHYYQNDYKGYFVFSKPKYKPNETVKFKTFIVHKKTGKPYDKPLSVYIGKYKKEKKIGEIKPYEKGGYTYQFDLVDSLGLALDKVYSIYLLDPKEKNIVNSTFKYEEYELGKNELAIRVDQKTHFKEKNVKLFIKATDENKLNLMDAKAEIILTSSKVHEYYADSVFVADTLYTLKKDLLPKGETEVVLPDSLFPKANFDYRLKVVMRTSDNETQTKKETINYKYELQQIASDLQKDSIQLSYLLNGDTVQKQGKVYGVDGFGNRTLQKEGTLPFTLQISPFYSSYKVELEDYEEEIKISYLSSSLQVYTDRTADSLEVKVENPRNIPFVYTFYEKNSEKLKGYTKDLSFKKEVKDNQNYYLTINYLWGGITKKENYLIAPVNELELKLDVDVPQLITPGQKSTIEVQVTDVKGQPVEGVDITAYGITKKFKYHQNPPATFTQKKKVKTVINNFEIKHDDRAGHLSLDYTTWKALAGLDSIPYYNFLYPEKGIYKATFPAENKITQFVPFVIHKGEIEPVHVVYVDNVPVYFGWVTVDQPYAISITEGKHHVRLRTSNHEISIKDLEFDSGKKTIFSVDYSYPLANVNVEKKKKEYTEEELDLWSRYILAYKKRGFENYTFLEQKDKVFFLNTSYDYNYSQYNLVGPIVGQTQLTVLDDYKKSFYVEPNKKYEFSSRNIKINPFDLHTHSFQSKLPVKDFYDEVLTKEQIKENWKQYIEKRRKNNAYYYFPKRTQKGQAQLLISMKEEENTDVLFPLNKLLMKLDDPEFIRVYPGGINTFHALDSGYYQLIYFYSENRYHIQDSLKVHASGVNYYTFEHPKQFKQDQFGKEFSEIIEKTIYQRNVRDKRAGYLIQIQQNYRSFFSYKGEGKTVKGKVFEKDGKTPISGVDVFVVGTNYGTITDINGHFSIRLPKYKDVLRFSSPNHEERDLFVKESSLDVILDEFRYDELEEIVVIGYGEQKKREVTGAIVSGSSEIMIRGVSSVSGNAEPLYVINGVPYLDGNPNIAPDMIKSISVLQDAASASIYGKKGANGVILIEVSPSDLHKIGLKMGEGSEMSKDFLAQAQKKNTIRNNFHDDAFWEPQLKSDKEGKVKFEVTFPDDITSWDTHFLAMNGKKQSGKATKSIKSYMPLAGQVNLPRFLVASDQVKAIGKSLNYVGDTLQSDIVFSVDKEKQWEKTVAISDAHIDTLAFTSTNDSVALSYTVTSKNGFFDGEERTIPVYPLGLELAKGGFYIMENDTTIHLKSTEGPTKIYAKSSYLGALESEIDHVIAYRYLCNEQLASKLKAHLSAYAISHQKGEKYKSTPQIEKLIKKLSKNNNTEQLWGWWEGNNTSYWISIHILEAFAKANELGFDVPINSFSTVEKLLVEFQSEEYENRKLRILNLIYQLDPEGNYQKYVSELGKQEKPSLNDQLQLMQLKQKAGLPIALSSIEKYKKETMFGNIYYENEAERITPRWGNRIINNDLQNTLLVYQIFKNDSLNNHENELKKIRNYLLEQRSTGYWVNTYTSSKVIETILPDVINDHGKVTSSALTLSGSKNETITQFPLELDLQKGEELTISKTGDFPVYLTQYSRYWENSPQEKSDHFEVNTYFEDQNTQALTAGEKVNLVVEVDVKKSADYVMVNVPIPAGCSYASKKRGFYNEVHREYFKNEVAIFCKKLKKGNYTFKVELLPRYTGNYHLNPAKAELMYFPTFYGNNELKEVGIQ